MPSTRVLLRSVSFVSGGGGLPLEGSAALPEGSPARKRVLGSRGGAGIAGTPPRTVGGDDAGAAALGSTIVMSMSNENESGGEGTIECGGASEAEMRAEFERIWRIADAQAVGNFFAPGRTP